MILTVKDAKIYFPLYRGILRRQIGEFRAVDGITFSLAEGEILGIVGESGSGKTTLGKAIAGLVPLTSGEIVFNGDPVRDLQMIFQDPYASLNPRHRVGESIIESLVYHKIPFSKGKTEELLEIVGLSPEIARRYPHEISGGQQQRVCIARALAMQPKLLICDEVVSSLDVSVQAQILNLLMDLQREFSLSYLFISHDLSVIRHICDRVIVMKKGVAVEEGGVEQVLHEPQNPYTKNLVSAIPKIYNDA